jgi:hypothetical protein
MRYALTVLLLTALVLAQSAPAPSASQNSTSIPVDLENARQAKAIIDQGIKALGGSAYLNWRTQTQEGRAYSFHHGETNSVGTQFWRFREFPDKERVELTPKRDVIDIFDGDKGYEVTWRGVRDLQPKEELDPYVRRHHYSLDIVLRTWLNQPGIALFYEGQKVAAQKETDQVTIMNAQNEAVTLNFDMETHLPVHKSFSWRDPTDKQRNVEEEIFDNYREAQGIMTPYDVTRIYNGEMAAQSFLTAANYNELLDPKLFDPHAPPDKKKKKH